MVLGEMLVQVHRPEAFHVVMGAGGKTQQEVYLAQLLADHVPLYKRKGGGGTVLLGPQTLIITVHAGVPNPFAHKPYFSAINSAIIKVLRQWSPLDYRERGISDIAAGDKKILGSSIYRRKQYLLYQASLIVYPELGLMDRYLKHPPREPDYRESRPHSDFVTSLQELGIHISWDQMTQSFNNLLPGLIHL